ncbi:hypothetical protein FQN57_002108 [Myotisia sp. PD_48]|nr:hypothetical protein FQN57_002108 [Myotisia sp. PD_48]
MEVFSPEATSGLVIEGLMNQLLVRGSWKESTSFTKHTYEDVSYYNSKIPWRRSPFWLVLRVAVQMVLRQEFGLENARIHYKNFGVYLVAQIGEKVVGLTMENANIDILELVKVKIARRISKLQAKKFDFVLDSARSIVVKIKRVQEHVLDSFNEPNIPSLLGWMVSRVSTTVSPALRVSDTHGIVHFPILPAGRSSFFQEKHERGGPSL